MKRGALMLLPLLLAAAQEPPNRPEQDGLLTVATSPALAPLIEREAAAYRREHPGLIVRVDARGSDIAMALLYTGQADLAVIGRQATDAEVKAYEWIYRQPPTERPLFAGSVSVADHSPSVGILVNQANPIRAISVDQLRGIYTGSGRPAGFSHAYLPDTESGTGRFLRHVLFADATLFAWGRVVEADNAIAVAKEKGAIALAAGPPPPGTKRIALRSAGKDWSPVNAGYPLTRTVYAYGAVDDASATPFIAFLSGVQGQTLAAATDYRPLAQAPGDVPK